MEVSTFWGKQKVRIRKNTVASTVNDIEIIHDDYMVGVGWSFENWREEAWAILTDSDGNIISSILTSGLREAGFSSLDVSGYNEICVAGENIRNNQDYYCWLSKIQLPLSVEDQETPKVSEFSILNYYPIPFNDSFILTFNVSVPQIISFQIFDVQGREISDFHSGYFSFGKNKISLNKNMMPQNLNAGVYYLKINGKKFNESLKIIKMP